MESGKLVEIMGPAGAGKSTLGRCLKHRCDAQLENPPYYRSVKDIPFFVTNSFLSIPVLAKLYRNLGGESLPLRQINAIVTLRGWPYRLKRTTLGPNAIVLLDQGPIPLMAFLHVNGPKVLKEHYTHQWWKCRYLQYADVLDTIVWLDASNDILINRIRNRETWHGLKEISTPEAFRILDNYRLAFEVIVGCLTDEVPQIRVLRFNTENETADQISEQVIVQLAT